MKIKADRMNELEKFGFVPCLGGIYTRRSIAIWSDGKILKRNRNGDMSYHKPYNHRFAVRSGGRGSTDKHCWDLVQVADLNHYKNDQMNRVYSGDGIAPTVETMSGGGREPKVLEPTILTPKRTEYGKAIRKDYEAGLHKESRHNFTQLEPKQDGTSNTLTSVQKDNMVVEPLLYDAYNKREIKSGVCGTLTAHGNTSNIRCGTFFVSSPSYRIRKLTPLECYRLMGFDDADFYKAKAAGVSDSQLYKQAGNSIVVNVLEAIFKQMEEI